MCLSLACPSALTLLEVSSKKFLTKPTPFVPRLSLRGARVCLDSFCSRSPELNLVIDSPHLPAHGRYWVYRFLARLREAVNDRLGIELSPMYKLSAESSATPNGLANLAWTAGPPSPEAEL